MAKPTQQEKSDFAQQVEKLVVDYHGYEDSGRLCYILLEDGTIKIEMGVHEAARIVAQHIRQA